MSLVLIGGLDPLGRAGLLADLEACRAWGVSPQVVCTALTAQDDKHCAVEPVPSSFVTQQLEVVLSQTQPLVVKTGWVATIEQLEAILSWLPETVKLIVDPLLVTSSGRTVFAGSCQSEPYQRFLSRADLVLPNLDEAKAILGAPIDDVTEAASALCARGIKRLLLKGGHAPGALITDLFMDQDGGIRFLRHDRIPGRHRGTGCRLASALAARLSTGGSFEEASVAAVRWLNEQLSR